MLVHEKATVHTKPSDTSALKLHPAGKGQFAQRALAEDARLQLPAGAPVEPSGLPHSGCRRAAARGQPNRRPADREEPPRRASAWPGPAALLPPPPAPPLPAPTAALRPPSPPASSQPRREKTYRGRGRVQDPVRGRWDGRIRGAEGTAG